MVDPESLTGDQPAPDAVAAGGPVDGMTLGETGPDSYEVVMADRSRHRYVRTAGGSSVYRWAGRSDR